MKRALLTLSTLALLVPANAFARGEFDPTKEFEQHEWIPIHLGPLNLSVTKAVVYLWIGAALTILLGLVLMRGKTLNRRQTAGEQEDRQRGSDDDPSRDGGQQGGRCGARFSPGRQGVLLTTCSGT